MNRPAQFIGTLATALAVVALVLALPAWLWFGAMGLEGVVYSTLATFIPGVLLALLANRFTGPQRAMQLMLVSTGLRVGFVLLMAFAVVRSRPELNGTEFYLGLAVFYFVAMAVETRYLMTCTAQERRVLADLPPVSPRQPQSN